MNLPFDFSINTANIYDGVHEINQWRRSGLVVKLKYLILLGVKYFSRSFYRFKIYWIGKFPQDPWSNVRLVLILNHTSLYEPLFAGWLPNRFLKRIACRGLVPVAAKTFRRPVVGRFFKWVAGDVVSVTRERDNTWSHFVSKVRPNSLVILAPEGRMMRSTGLDSQGNPMTVRGGVADLLHKIPVGRMLIAYSGGLHHIQIPSQKWPRLFKTLSMSVESLDIARYREELLARVGFHDFKQAVIRDLEFRRDQYCPWGQPN